MRFKQLTDEQIITFEAWDKFPFSLWDSLKDIGLDDELIESIVSVLFMRFYFEFNDETFFASFSFRSLYEILQVWSL